MNKFLSKRTLLTIIGLLISAATVYVIAYLAVIKPMQAELESTKTTIELFQKQVKKIDEEPSTNSNPGIDVTQVIPIKPQPDAVLLRMKDFATKANLTINLVESVKGNLKENAAPENLPKGIKKTSYTIEATAKNIENVNTFLISLKENKRLFLVKDLEVNKADGIISVQVTFTAFHLTSES